MTMKLELSPDVQAALLDQARQSGLSLTAFAEQVLKEKSQAGGPANNTPAIDAIQRLVTFGKRHNLSLGGMTIKELLHESRP